MNKLFAKSLFTLRQVAACVAVLALTLGAFALPAAQTVQTKALTIDDYGKWRSIDGQVMSDDGKWVAYTLRFGVLADGRLTNVQPAEAKPVLHVLNLETGAEVTVADATGATFSPDSQWIA